MVYAKEALANIAICRVCEANGGVDNAAFYEYFSFFYFPAFS